jgi:serine/threonine protein kinase/Tfp pilus assembly protein PilF
MNAKASSLDGVVESVADGDPIDWRSLETVTDEAARRRLRYLRIVAQIAEVHRTQTDDDSAYMPATVIPAQHDGLVRWGHLLLLEKIGEGGFGEVYRARDSWLDREVALKLLKPGNASGEATARVLREARTLARIRNANVVTVHGADVNDARVGLWMELVRGRTLEDLLRSQGPFGPAEAALIGRTICRALAAIHAAGLLHRDIKAANVMRESGGRIVLMDLGTGRDSAADLHRGMSDLAGTPLYQAPEIFAGSGASERSDLYSVGVLLYHLVTGSYPVQAKTTDALEDAHATGTSVRLRDARADLPTSFVQVIDRAIAADPAERYQTAGALEAGLIRALDESDMVPAVGKTGAVGPSRMASWHVAAIALSLVLLVGLAAIGVPSLRSQFSTTPAISPAAIRSIAVLPLANVSGDPTQDYFSDGMTDELIATLGRLNGVNVISRTSVMQFKGSTSPVHEIAKRLRVDAILEGSVMVVPGGKSSNEAAPKRVRISARLVRAGADTQLWSRTFETIVTDVMALQSQVAKAVADGIDLHLTAQNRQALARVGSSPGTQIFDAFDLYLKGRYEWNRRTEPGLRQSVLYFKEAIARAPTFALAYAGLADAHNLLGDYGFVSRSAALKLAADAATKALELDDSLAEAHTSLGFIRLNQFAWTASETAFRRALTLNPGYATAHQWYAFFLTQQGRFQEAISEAGTAAALDPLSVGVNAMFGYVLTDARRYDEALAQYEKAAALDPSFHHSYSDLAKTHILRGDVVRALLNADRASASGARDPFVLGDIGHVYAVAGNRTKAIEIVNDLAARYQQHDAGAAMAVATIYAGLRDVGRTFQWLNLARAVDDPVVADIKSDPRFDSVRDDPRFAKLLASVGLTK